VFVDYTTISTIWPELMLVGLATWIIVLSAFQKSRWWWSVFAVCCYGLAALAMFRQDSYLWPVFAAGNAEPYTGPIAVDFLAHGARWLALVMGVLFTLMLSGGARDELHGEITGCLMLLTTGVMIACEANDLVLLFLGLELISIPTYVLLFLTRNGRPAAEATVKYFFLSILSSALLLYGFTFLYGIAGSTNLSDIHAAMSGTKLEAGELLSLAPVALVLIVAGLGFKIAAAPFHFYAPDVYQGAANTGAGLLATAPKIAGIIVLLRLVVFAMPAASGVAWQLMMTLSLFTMTIGNVCALWQNDIRRMLGYSSIAHSGYMLIGVTTALALPATGDAGVSAVLIYLTVYCLASATVFAALTFLSGPGREVSGLRELDGLGKTRPAAAAVIAVSMFSLAGIPPLAGFWGKFSLFGGALQTASATGNSNVSFWLYVLVIVGALNAAIAAAYYLRVVSAMYFREQVADTPARGGEGAMVAMAIAAILTCFTGASPHGVAKLADIASKSVRSSVIAESKAAQRRRLTARTSGLKAAAAKAAGLKAAGDIAGVPAEVVAGDGATAGGLPGDR